MESQIQNPLLEREKVAQLVRAAQAGDRAAFGQLVVRYEQSIHTIAMRRLNNHAEAQELCQEVFIKAMEKIDQLKVPEAFGSWLRSITVRMAINRIVRRAPLVATETEVLDSASAHNDTPLDSALASERKTQVHAGLDRLRALDRETLEAFYLQGQSLLEMSDTFDSPVGTIKRRLHVARKRLAKELEVLAV